MNDLFERVVNWIAGFGWQTDDERCEVLVRLAEAQHPEWFRKSEKP